MRTSLALVVALSLSAACASSPPPATTAPASAAPATGLDARRQQLRDLVAERWEYTLRTSPEFASTLGDKRYNDKWSDLSEKAVYDDIDRSKRDIGRLEAVDTAGFPEQERLNKVLLLQRLQRDVESAKFEDWLMPVNQFTGPHIDVPQLVSLLPFASVKDYDDYVTRLQTLPAVFDEVVRNMKKGLTKGLVPPKILLGKVADQAEALANAPPADSVFAHPLTTFPAAVPEADRARIRAAVLAAISDKIEPAYRAFAAFVRADYEPHGRAEVGVWSLPLGQERYAFLVKRSTTTDLTPDEIHEIGMKEVTRVQTEMTRVAKSLGFADPQALKASIDKNPALHFGSRQAVVDLYRKYLDEMYPKLPTLFGHLPKAKLEVRPIEAFMEKGAAAAQYNSGSPDGARPGHVEVNTGDFANRTNIVVETTAYHEGVPGHHLQLSMAQEVPELPPFRQQFGYTAYVEGWALYSERLGEEVGLYKDPYSYFGHLQDEMLRAIRLVVDTGLHSKKWTRQQVVDFFHAHSTSDEVEVQAETDRYIAIPSQALGYKIGQLRILELREKAKKALGDKFDIRGFHDVVIDSGALPLDVLGDQVDRWIASRKAG